LKNKKKSEAPAGPAGKLEQTGMERLRKFLKVAKRLFVVVVLIICVSFGAGAAYEIALTNGYFNVDTVKIIGARTVGVDAVAKTIGPVYGVNIFSFDLLEAGAKLTAQPWVRSVELRRELPSKIKIILNERSPAITVDMKGRWLVDAQGVLLRKAEPGEMLDYAHVTGIRAGARIAPGEKIDSGKVFAAVRALDALADYRLFGKHAVKNVHVSKKRLTIGFADSGVKVIVPAGEWSDERRGLRTVDYWLRGREEALISIDRTFKDKVITTYPTKKKPEMKG